ncbi:MAG: glycoside hydrolase family 2 protein, partial [Fibrobacter sp.]|nr:glycoside hydrolase family 2 protein [Fibrobacter sp.]
LLSQNTVLFTSPRFIDFRKEPIQHQIHALGEKSFQVDFFSSQFHHQACFDLKGLSYEASDNYFDIFPDLPVSVRIELSREMTAEQLTRRLSVMSLVDSY